MRLRSSGLFLLLALATGSGLVAGDTLAQTPPGAGVAHPAPVESSPLPPPAAPAPAVTPAAPAIPAPATPAQVTPSAEPAKPEAPKPEAPMPQPPAPGPTQPQAPVAGSPATPAPAPTATARSTLFPNPGDPTNVEEGVLVAKPAVVLPGTSTWDEGFSTLKATFRKIEDELKKAGIAPAGRPLTVFVHTDDMGFRFEAMIPIAQVPEGRAELTPEIRFGKTPEGKAFRFVHKDAYDEIDGTYETITAYLDAKDIVSKDAFIEEYVNELTDAQDTNLEVNIYVQPKE